MILSLGKAKQTYPILSYPIGLFSLRERCKDAEKDQA